MARKDEVRLTNRGKARNEGARKLKYLAVLVWALVGAAFLAGADWTLYLNHAGPVKIGMTVEEARKAIGDPSAKLESPGDSADSCGYLSSKKLPDGVGLMFVERRLARIDVTKRGIRTASGAQVGDSEDSILKLYSGHIHIDQHHYIDGHYVRYIPTSAADRSYELLFETDGKKVLEFRAGQKEAVGYVEGCL